MPILRDSVNGKMGRISAVAVLVAVGLFSLSSCAKKPEPMKKPPVPVIVAPVTQRTLPLQLTAIGNVEALKYYV